MKCSSISVAQSSAFLTAFELPPTGSGMLDGLCFAVKDVIDVAGWKTGCGNPTWRDSHPPAIANAVCVEQLLRAGRAASAKPFRMNWLSAFLVRITFTARLSTHRRLIASPVGRRVDRLPPWLAVLWILLWERTRAALPAFLRAIVGSGASGRRTALYHSLESIHWRRRLTLSASSRRAQTCSQEWASFCWPARRLPRVARAKFI